MYRNYKEPCKISGQAVAIMALALGMAMCSLSHANLSLPAVIWWSAPVMPGEIVLLHGGDWGDNPKVEIASIRNSESGEAATGRTPVIGDVRVLVPIHRTETGLSFVLPETLEGLHICRVISGVRGPSAPFVLNEPDLVVGPGRSRTSGIARRMAAGLRSLPLLRRKGADGPEAGQRPHRTAPSATGTRGR